MKNLVVLSVIVCCVSGRPASAQTSSSFQVAAQVAVARSGEFESSEFGFGGRLAWTPNSLVGFESEITVYPAEFPNGFAFSGSRIEGLFGLTAGPRLGGLRPFARLRAGFLHYSGKPIACVAIFPPPLNCLLAAGGNRPIVDLGGGVELFTGARTFIRADAGDRMVRYPGPSFVGGLRRRRDTGFFGHDLRVAIGAGFRF
ncbi:MAG: hypothetical protein A3J29_17215 [Acidobacteria bacterium RIFCSPLOWO2_12_FULL_67_14b]|nr:MAG: hypothetical protein A3J29_17215 [Acidobacteria bacterium RIFCSPLOWO2_12_FULL_67_14b]